MLYLAVAFWGGGYFFLFTGEGFGLVNHRCLPKCQLFWVISSVDLGIWQKVSIFTPNLCV